MKKILLTILPLLLTIGCDTDNPTLCDCLKKPYNEVKKFDEHCNGLKKKEFGTTDPSVNQMMRYVNRECGGM
jgi:hypothetical protein